MALTTSPKNIAASLTELWSPRVVAELDDHFVEVAKLHGNFGWHAHADEDELFMVLQGRLRIEMENKLVELDAGGNLRRSERCTPQFGRQRGMSGDADRTKIDFAHWRQRDRKDPLANGTAAPSVSFVTVSTANAKRQRHATTRRMIHATDKPSVRASPPARPPRCKSAE
jgi:hypothetical protein